MLHGLKTDMPQCLTRISQVNACYLIAEEMAEEFEENIRRLEREIHTDTATEEGISHKERMYKLKPGELDTLEERRFRVQIYERTIILLNKETLESYVDYIADGNVQITVNKAKSMVSVEVGLASKKMFDIIKNTVSEFIPVWMTFEIKQMYRTYESYSGQTYEELSEKTYEQLRNEV